MRILCKMLPALAAAFMLTGCMAPISPVGPQVPSFSVERLDTVEEAQQRVDFAILKPSHLPTGYEFIGAEAHAAAEGQYSRLVYASGETRIIIGQGFSDNSFLPLTDEALQPGQQRVTVQGHPGMGNERQTRLILHEPAQPAPGYVTSPLTTPAPSQPFLMTLDAPAGLRWWPLDQEVAIWTDDMALTLADLIAIAESMQPLQGE